MPLLTFSISTDDMKLIPSLERSPPQPRLILPSRIGTARYIKIPQTSPHTPHISTTLLFSSQATYSSAYIIPQIIATHTHGEQTLWIQIPNPQSPFSRTGIFAIQVQHDNPPYTQITYLPVSTPMATLLLLFSSEDLYLLNSDISQSRQPPILMPILNNLPSQYLQFFTLGRLSFTPFETLNSPPTQILQALNLSYPSPPPQNLPSQSARPVSIPIPPPPLSSHPIKTPSTLHPPPPSSISSPQLQPLHPPSTPAPSLPKRPRHLPLLHLHNATHLPPLGSSLNDPISISAPTNAFHRFSRAF